MVVAGALAAGFVHGLSGTGYALVALGFWLQAMSPVTAAPLVALCSVCAHLQALPAIWPAARKGQRRGPRPPPPPPGRGGRGAPPPARAPPGAAAAGAPAPRHQTPAATTAPRAPRARA